MHPDYREMFLKNYFHPEEREQSENDSGTSEDLHSNEVGHTIILSRGFNIIFFWKFYQTISINILFLA